MIERDFEHRRAAEALLGILGSRARIRILAFLSFHADEAFSKYRIAQATRLEKANLSVHLGILLENGVLKKLDLDAACYQLNQKDERAKIIMGLFRAAARPQKDAPDR